MLEVDDIQHFLLTRTPALAARYEFLTFRKSAAGRAWLAGLIDKVGTGKSVGSASPDSRWVTLAFTWNGLRALGVDEVSLETFPEEFRQGMVARAEIMSRNGSYLAYLRLQEHAGAFRDLLRQQGQTPDEQELVAAKLMGRWRSGAPLVLAPQKDDPALGVDLQRTNNFDYGKMDPYGYACPVGAHIRRMNPRDTADNMQRRQMIRRGGTYGSLLAEDAPEDGAERGIAAFIGCASLIRQFEFAMNVWVNDPRFKDLGNERDPFVGTQDGTFDMTIPKRPVRKKIKGLPAFTTIRGGAYFFLPGIRALRLLAAGASALVQKPRKVS